MAKRGRPSSYRTEVADAICQEIATTDHGITNICARPGMPDLKTVYKWLDKHEDFLQLYTRARERQMDFMACQIRDIADNQEPGIIERTDKDGNVMTETRDMLEHRRLRIESRKWLMAHLAPRKYGDRLAVTDPDGAALAPMTLLVMPAGFKPPEE